MITSEPSLLPIIRCEADRQYGIRREDVIATEYESEVYQHCLTHLANLVWDEKLEFIRVSLPEMDGRAPVYVLLRQGTAQEFREMVEDLTGYTYSPYGPGALSFGYLCDTLVAWIIPHRDYPALIVRDPGDQAIENFFDAADLLRGNLPPWPTPRKKPTVIEPVYKLPPLKTNIGRKRLQPRKKRRRLTAHGR